MLQSLQNSYIGGKGMIKIHLSKLLGEKRWTQADLARRTGIRPGTINELYHEFTERVNIDHLDLICDALGCPVSDILEHVPGKKKRNRKG